MSRSKAKGPFCDGVLLNILYKQKSISSKLVLKTQNRSISILPSFVGQTFKVHNGKQYLRVIITKAMVGHKFGEFALTRKKHEYKAKKTKKKTNR